MAFFFERSKSDWLDLFLSMHCDLVSLIYIIFHSFRFDINKSKDFRRRLSVSNLSMSLLMDLGNLDGVQVSNKVKRFMIYIFLIYSLCNARNLFYGLEFASRYSWLILFRDDSAIHHNNALVCTLLENIFRDKWLAKYGSFCWPAASPDLPLLESFIYGYVKGYSVMTVKLNNYFTNIQQLFQISWTTKIYSVESDTVHSR